MKLTGWLRILSRQRKRGIAMPKYEKIKSARFNLLLTEREGRTGEYWPEVVTVQTSLRSVRTKTTEGQYSPVRPELARLVRYNNLLTNLSLIHI